MSIKGVKRELHLTKDELSDWKRKYNALEAEKQKLINEMRDLQRNKVGKRTE